MDAADTARSKEPDADRSGDRERSADCRRADSTLRRAGGEIPRAELPCLAREALELVRLEPDANRALEDADRRRHGAGVAHGSAARQPDLDAVGGSWATSVVSARRQASAIASRTSSATTISSLTPDAPARRTHGNRRSSRA
jgi:hypothetical protein